LVDHAHVLFRESAPEPGEGGMIGRGLIERETEKLLVITTVFSQKFMAKEIMASRVVQGLDYLIPQV
jgi:hypothetical protein